MKIGYDGCMYHVKVEFPETDLHSYADNIEGFKRNFLEYMEHVFDETVNKQLEESLKEIGVPKTFNGN